ncbi:MAG: DUF2282 domain-containing protein [Hyphomicrobiaceae bacterium]|nr:DUF2282 domain-containing protein [Hyphomicrobiaceae bacterium]
MKTNRVLHTSKISCCGMIAALLFVSALGSVQAKETKLEKCYGVVAKGQDDGLASGPNADVPGSSTVDYDGNAFKLVPKGTCKSITTPHGQGSLTPIADRPPKS